MAWQCLLFFFKLEDIKTALIFPCTSRGERIRSCMPGKSNWKGMFWSQLLPQLSHGLADLPSPLSSSTALPWHSFLPHTKQGSSYWQVPVLSAALCFALSSWQCKAIARAFDQDPINFKSSWATELPIYLQFLWHNLFALKIFQRWILRALCISLGFLDASNGWMDGTTGKISEQQCWFYSSCTHVSVSIHSRYREKGYGNSRKPLEMSPLLMNLYMEI